MQGYSIYNEAYNAFDLLTARDEGYKCGMIETEATISTQIDNMLSFEHIEHLNNDYEFRQGYILALQHLNMFIKENGRRLRNGGK